MDYLKWVVTAIALLLPLLIILLYKLWSGRRSSDASNNVDNACQHPDSIASASDAADSDTLLPLPIGEYEVFLSFRGPDTRYQITDILYRFLVNLKIHTFKDDDELRKGEGIWPNLVKAIEQSKIYVPVLSENYAYSKWCLREIAAIVERQEREKGCIILPIFYMVDPRDVRHQSGPYERAFQQHMKNFDERTVKVWKEALSKVGALKGWLVQNNNEQGAIADLVTGIVWSQLSKDSYVLKTDVLIGVQDHIEAITERMTLNSGGVKIVGIHGMGGIGKTTVAKAVYNKVSAQFDRCSFVENVREMLQQKNGFINLQKCIISDILRGKSNESIVNASEGIKLIRDRISRFKCLIVLDDVDEKFEFDEILGNIETFVSGSRFIITSRNVKVLSTLTEESKLYRVREMRSPHDLQLFCRHAFKKDSPPSSYEALSKDIVSITGGLPLALKVVGSSLFKEEGDVWIDKLRQLKEVPEEKVVERLKISYDTLSSEAKQIFLDIACFFIGVDKEMPCYMWSDCGFFPIVNTNILIQRSMIELAKDNRLQMHDQLRDMGREIVRLENTKHPWQRSRIWSSEQALDMLHNKKGTNQVEAIRMDSSIADHGKFEFGEECFQNLTELRYLDAKSAKLTGDLSDHLRNLRWLRLESFYSAHLWEMKDLANISMENLVILQLLLPVLGDWEGWSHIKMANKLKVMKLSYVHTQFLQFPQSQSLEILDVGYFGVPQSPIDLDIENLRNLKVLRLKKCYVREIRGGSIGMMKRLQELDINSVVVENNLGETLVDIGELQNLEILSIKEVVGGNESLYEGVLFGTRLPTRLKVLLTSSPVANLSELVELEELRVGHCGYGLEIPTADKMWWKISKLKFLDLEETKMTIPVTTSPSLPLLPSSLITLRISSCPELDWLPNLENLENLNRLWIAHCPLLKGIPGLGRLKSLGTLIIRLETVCNLDGLDNLHSLKILSVSNSVALERLPSVASLSKLVELDISSCPRLLQIQGFEGLKSLEKLTIRRAKSLTRLQGVGTLVSFNRLRSLSILDCRHLPSLSFDNLVDGQLATVLDSLQDLDRADKV